MISKNEALTALIVLTGWTVQSVDDAQLDAFLDDMSALVRLAAAGNRGWGMVPAPTGHGYD